MAHAEMLSRSFPLALGLLARGHSVTHFYMRLGLIPLPAKRGCGYSHPNLFDVLAEKITWGESSLGLAQVRHRVGLPRRMPYWRLDRDPARLWWPILCAWSPSVVPSSSDGRPHVHVTGWYFFDINMLYTPYDDFYERSR